MMTYSNKEQKLNMAFHSCFPANGVYVILMNDSSVNTPCGALSATLETTKDDKPPKPLAQAELGSV